MPESGPVQDLIDALKREPRLAHGASVAVEVSGNVVALRGEAGDIAAKRRAYALARQCLKGRCRIVDALRLRASKRLGTRELAMTVGERLLQEPVFADYSIDVGGDGDRTALHDAGSGAHVVRVSSRDDVVTLAGTVGTLTHRRLAEVIAWWTGACALVLNALEVVPPEEDTDDELNDAVRIVLEKDPLVDAGQLRVGTAAGIVHVEGLTISPEQRDSVLEDIWLVPGVADIVDRVETYGFDGRSRTSA